MMITMCIAGDYENDGHTMISNTEAIRKRCRYSLVEADVTGQAVNM